MRSQLVGESLEEFARRSLGEHRAELLASTAAMAKDENEELDEREPDWEDRAAHVTAAQRLQRLGETERLQLTMVQAALARLDAGTWGWCVACGQPIDEARLRAAPEASRCRECTNHH
jgi:RNA polymerase-binding protein DksA